MRRRRGRRRRRHIFICACMENLGLQGVDGTFEKFY
jgi:DNA-binding transcriptional regulator YbjK